MPETCKSDRDVAFLNQIITNIQVFVERATMKMIIQASVFHEIVEEKVADGGHGVATQSDKISMLDVPQCLQLCLEFVDILCKMIVQLLDSNGMAVLQAAPVNRT